MMTSKKLTIFEGPDGAGKTQLAKAFAAVTGAYYVHCGPFSGVTTGLARLYVEAMMPAVLGYTDVVMDRCWVSERPYGAVFRSGADRLGARTRILERLAWRCQTLVVRCLPTWQQLENNWGSKPEMLNRITELKDVYDYYAFSTMDVWGSLPFMQINTLNQTDSNNFNLINAGMFNASIPHLLAARTAGNIRGAKVLLVGAGNGGYHDCDPLYRWPFGSFAPNGYSVWIAGQLDTAGISERDLYWATADDLTLAVKNLEMLVISIGDTAHQRLVELGRSPDAHAPHPANCNPFDKYPLIGLLKEMI